MTAYGLNPSFCDTWSTLPLFANLIRRGKQVDPDGSVKLIAPHDGTVYTPVTTQCVIERSTSGLLRAKITGRLEEARASLQPGDWHRPSLQALAALKPAVLRTLDWQCTNKRPDWSKPRVMETDVLQGTDRGMAIELQAKPANLLGCHLWWCAPPRFELTAAEYEERLSQMLLAIRDTSFLPPILEYGNELWNAGFPVHGWLRSLVSGTSLGTVGEVDSWQRAAAREIATLKRVADRVFGPPGLLGQRRYYLFVGGQLTVPSHLDRILGALADLGVCPDIAGPALYITPLKASMEEWARTGAVPTQEELRDSMFARLREITYVNRGYGALDGSQGSLEQHRILIKEKHGVPYFACYEANASFIARSPNGQPLPWRKAALEAQRTEWLGDLVREIRRVAESAGVDLLLWYSAAGEQEPTDTRLDPWGLLESADLMKMLPKALAARGE